MFDIVWEERHWTVMNITRSLLYWRKKKILLLANMWSYYDSADNLLTFQLQQQFSNWSIYEICVFEVLSLRWHELWFENELLILNIVVSANR